MSRAPKSEAVTLLQKSVGPDATFRPDQWEAIDSLVNEAGRLLLVQRTGWGKSTVYFIATRLLRDRGAGPTLIISPLLALMRNQVADAEDQLGLKAATIHSGNTDEWDDIQEDVINGDVDLLLISPERLANARFQQEVLSEIADELGLLVIDEAHCISSWGHDFRPDYRRISHVLDQFPEEMPIAATTATANDRVVEDVTDQLPGLEPVRGNLVRESVRIQAIEMESRTERLAWLTENLHEFPGSGIIYCLTTSETENVAGWLTEHGFDARPYHGRMDGEVRSEREEQLLDNEIDALVATNALGMGFNKPDLGWVIHFHRPPNLIRYYQEIGRAGRALDEAYAVVFSGPEDDEIAEFFIEQAFPSPEEFHDVLTVIEESNEPLYKYQILRRADVSWQATSSCLNILDVEGAIRIEDDGFVRTDAEWSYNFDRVEAVTRHRYEELRRIKEFVVTDDCLTRFVDDELDGQLTEDCGRCANCVGDIFPRTVENGNLIEEARGYFRSHGWQEIKPRKYLHKQDGGREKIPEDEQLETGRSMSVLKDPGWGSMVYEGKYEHGQFSDELVTAAAEFIEDWDPKPVPEWVTAVPSNRYDGLVTGFAVRLAEHLDLPFLDVVECVGDPVPQEELSNSYQQCWNVSDTFEVPNTVRATPVLLVDDIVGSRWTLTQVGMALRRAGCGPVHPFTLAERRFW